MRMSWSSLWRSWELEFKKLSRIAYNCAVLVTQLSIERRFLQSQRGSPKSQLAFPCSSLWDFIHLELLAAMKVLKYPQLFLVNLFWSDCGWWTVFENIIESSIGRFPVIISNKRIPKPSTFEALIEFYNSLYVKICHFLYFIFRYLKWNKSKPSTFCGWHHTIYVKKCPF